MVKQLEIPTFFLTLSSADLRWNEILTIIRKLNESDFDISNSHIMIAVKLFVVDEPLGTTKNYAIQVEFQVRGSLHIH